MIKKEILEKRKEIEKELLVMLKETGSDFSLDDIKEIISNGKTSTASKCIKPRLDI